MLEIIAKIWKFYISSILVAFIIGVFAGAWLIVGGSSTSNTPAPNEIIVESSAE